ncbi:MAG TPA: MBL fold metallo-hydrolase, partial [Flavobacteriales bacterium]|nr:MBL fold metallo-hydrolase [Flavobacteriales bacterium]
AGIDELRAYNFAQQRSMDLLGQPRALEAIRSTFHYAFSEHKYPGVPELDLIPVGHGPFRVNDVEIVPVQVMHDRLPILGYRVGALAYITDAKTIAQEERVKLQGLEVLV